MTWLDKTLGPAPPSAIDTQTTLAELCAQSIARCLAEAGLPDRLLVSGGGAHNVFLMRRIAAALPEVVVESTARHGVEPDWAEGLLFAWLARERLNGRIQDTTDITGANQPELLGEIHQPPVVDL